ncbi:phosphoribosyltransferase [Defluviimonas salinarum]|uniref:Phosphoribosyltransferase family protein n=1 Tax=Defluviimonas salinarum TaxID=2992147 RepID=A0ABT3J523_9RHOB|nr:phosphoribosyltransferase family protein [Defluviimonas salinarum]MCW3782775.1 phosphoribosyltransferase family protein [Defluviimonas salinarum]
MFTDRVEAGRKMADEIEALAPEMPVVLALPRGGVPVAAEIAARLGAPLGLILVRKIGVPGHEELAAGAVAEGGAPVFNPDVLASIRRGPEDFADAVAAKRREMAERRRIYLGDRAEPDLAGATAIVVDDGIATGATLRAALGALRAAGPAAIVLAVPVAPEEALAEFAGLADRVICLQTPRPFIAVGAHYRAFPQVADAEVVALLDSADGRGG